MTFMYYLHKSKQAISQRQYFVFAEGSVIWKPTDSIISTTRGETNSQTSTTSGKIDTASGQTSITNWHKKGQTSTASGQTSTTCNNTNKTAT